jgi:broad specificity phosphatase PhoE/CTP:molybdopterin cytidylyltransferase MocA
MTEDRKIAALIPAAGFSSRMVDFKPLLPMGQSTVVQEAVERFRRAGIEDIRVITGHCSGEMALLLEVLRVTTIFNPDYSTGMFSSILAGVRSLEPDIDAFFLLPVDIPLVKPGTIQTLFKAYLGRGAGIVYPRFEGFRGHPPLVSRRLVADLPAECDGGLTAFLDRYKEQALDIEVTDQSILMDCDTPLDYLKLQAYRSREYIPTERECRAILRMHGGTELLIAHSRMVAEIAGRLAVGLKRAGFDLNLDLITASGLLHDLAKGQADHARAGAEILEKLGYGEVARVVELHTDLGQKKLSMDESDLVYLADKFVKGDLPVSLEQRFDGPMKKFAARSEVIKAVQRRLDDARTLKERLEKTLGVCVEDIVHECERNLRMASDGHRNIYLARHCSVTHPGGLKRFIGQTDLPLSAEGLQQAEILAEKLLHIPFTAIYSSDLRRSVDTARIIGKLHGIEPVEVSGFREIRLGEWEGLPVGEVRHRYPSEYEQRGRNFANFRAPGGESFLDLAARVMTALYKVLGSTNGDILIVGHAGMNRVLLCRILGKSLNELFDIPQDYGCLNLIRYRDLMFDLDILNETV